MNEAHNYERYVTITPNPNGKIYLLGDLHGALDVLNAVLQQLTPEDTLVIVGDLIDRGYTNGKPSSAEVLDIIMAHQPAAPDAASKPKIYSIRGNHEEDFSLLLSDLQKYSEKRILHRKQLLPQIIQWLSSYVKNGSPWIINTTTPENATEKEIALAQKRSALSVLAQQMYSREKAVLWSDQYNQFKKLITECMTDTEYDIFGLFIPKFKTYEAFLRTLPAIIKIEGQHPAFIVHADCPFTDEQLNINFRENTPLGDKDRRHLMRIRPLEIKEFEAQNQLRGPHSILVVCGHNIVTLTKDNAETSATQYPVTPPYRPNTNTINLDNDASKRHATILVNLTDLDPMLITTESTSPEDRATLEWLQGEYKTALKTAYPLAKRKRNDDLNEEKSDHDDDDESSLHCSGNPMRIN